MSPHKPKPLTAEQIAASWALFGPPPLLNSENQQAYDAIRTEYLAYYRPRSALHVKLIREVVDNEWEIFRIFRHRTVGIETPPPQTPRSKGIRPSD